MLEAIREEMRLAELFKKCGVYANQICTWKRAAIENMASAFTRRGAATEQVSAAEIEKLHSKIGQLVVERDFWLMPPFSCSGYEAEMVSWRHKLRVRLCTLLTLTRSSRYYEPKGESIENLRFMEIIDKQFLEVPWHGSHQMARYMRRRGHKWGRHCMRRLMRFMRLVSVFQELNASKKHPQYKIWPYHMALSAERYRDRPSEPDLVRRYHLHSDAARFPISCGDHGLVQPQCAGLAAVQQRGCGLLRRRFE